MKGDVAEEGLVSSMSPKEGKQLLGDEADVDNDEFDENNNTVEQKEAS